MGYLYKLIDATELEFAKKGSISLSHPIFEFKGSEGKFINFAKRIYDKYAKQGLEVTPSQTDIQDITDWVTIFKSTCSVDYTDNDIISDAMIIFCGIIQGFCGYFTTIDLFDKEHLISYLEKCRLSNKKYVLKLDETVFQNHHWRTENLDTPFIPFHGDPNDWLYYNGFTHPTDIVYIENYDNYNELLKIYNSDYVRSSHNWFNNLSKEFEWQREKRIIFLLRSLDGNGSRIACTDVYGGQERATTCAEAVYNRMVDAIDYCKNKSPRYIYLNVGVKNLEWKTIDELTK